MRKSIRYQKLLLILTIVCIIAIFIVLIITEFPTNVDETITKGTVIDCTEKFIPIEQNGIYIYKKGYKVTVKVQENIFITEESTLYRIGTTVNVKIVKEDDETSYYLSKD